ncbi:2TM domain-containing protein [Variovorax sp. 54]|uniref:2TM domain-containing protein n=1 Tax=Variovorax sp. 54 TaxID=2035212 RepID=UPI000C175883|nr:2TM domain-containing protein [Variovorax sp. 54]PIF74052.1 2TM domain-containing protein [Variovorax sp. 54]
MNTSTPSNRADADLEKRARRRAGAKMGWFIHAFVYVVVNVGLVGLAASRGHNWAVYPLMGWGLGLLIHGAVVWLIAPGGGLYDRLLERERRALGGGDRR